MTFAVLLTLLSAGPVPESEPLALAGPYRLELVLFDAPANLREGGVLPSMQQALAATRTVQGGLSWAIDLGFENLRLHPVLRWALEAPALVALTVAMVWTPLGTTWNHEEFHRAVMSWRGVSSFDEVYRFPVGSSAVAVTHVLDDDLARFKAEHPAEYVRMSTSGMEGDLELARWATRENFFARRDPRVDLPMVAFNRLSVIGYMWMCDQPETSASTAEFNAIEVDPRTRDFTGWDCLGWAYDVQRPDEPYAARGPHPSGVGVDRYRTLEHLTPEERRLMRQAATLSWLNLLDASMLGLALPAPAGWPEWTFGTFHEMTSFGQLVGVDLLVRASTPLRLTYLHALNKSLQLPGLEVAWVRHPLRLRWAQLYVSPSVSAWLQPTRQRYDAVSSTPGALARLRLDWLASERLGVFAQLQGKTAGFFPGVESLEAGWSVLAGATLQL